MNMRRVTRYTPVVLCAIIAMPMSVVAATTPPDTSQGLHFELRGSFTEIQLYGANDGDLFQAEGAQATYTINEITHQNGVSLDGVAAAIWRDDDSAPFLDARMYGLYIQGDGTHNFKTPTALAKSSDAITMGGFFQWGVHDPVGSGNDYFRVRGGFSDGSSGTQSTTAVGEWIPSYGETQPHAAFGYQPIFMQVIPELMVQFDHLNGGPNTYQLFADHRDALRVGPQINIKFWGVPFFIKNDFLRDVVAPMTLSLTYHAAADLFSGRASYSTQEVFTYNFGKHNNFGVSLSYGYGDSEATGNRISQIKIGFAAKF